MAERTGIKLIDPDKKKYRIRVFHRGKEFKKIIVGGNRRLAEDVEAKMKLQLVEGAYFPERTLKRLSFEYVANRFLKEYAAFLKSANKVEIYVRGSKLFFKGKMMTEIAPYDVQRFREELGRKMMPVSVNHYHRVLRRLFYWAEEVGIFQGKNPASGKRVKLEIEKKYWRKEYLEADELKAILEAAHPRIRPIIMTAAFTGMRKGELEKLRKKDINLDSCTICISESKNDEPGYVPITDILFPILGDLIKQADGDQLVLDFRNFDRFWKVARKTVNLSKKISFHTLRHTLASHVVMKTGNKAVVQALLRHKDPRTVERYAHLAPGVLRTAALTLDTTFSNLREANREPRNPVLTVPETVPAEKPVLTELPQS
ncbi:MAG: site-specific integrase [Elusimicrobia bacterium]|nr:site-specific integrase [Elusimicrobiota bacterium]